MNDAQHSTTALSVTEIEFAYGQLQVLFGISLEIERGEAVALLGTNGAGKSTLLRVISGMEKPTRGTVRYFDEDITGMAAERLPGRGLLLVVGGKSVFTDMTVKENLEMQAFTARLDRKSLKIRLDEVFETFPVLGARLKQKGGSLSGGEQQQLAVAKALLLEPKVLCIDEMSLGLVPVVVAEMIDMVRRLRATGVTILLVEQSLNIAAELCERAIFLEKGQVRFEGLTQDLISRDDIARAVFLGSSTPLQ